VFRFYRSTIMDRLRRKPWILEMTNKALFEQMMQAS
jgi:hypothetical protein